MTNTESRHGLLAKLLSEAKRGIAFTGAGISTESGIPDFRSPGGVWSRHRPVMYDDFLADPAERRRYWLIRRATVPQFLSAKPNAGHDALAALESRGCLGAIITQNIDELHQRAGSRRVLELHGTALRIHCLSCGRRYACDELQPRLEADDLDPRCDGCGGILKSMTVSFGQDLPADVWAEAVNLTERADLFLALGSSLVVHPAARLPEIAVRNGAELVIINRDPTPLDHLAELVIREPIGMTMSAVMAAMPPAK
jgi:NAD-dependent deacetylase